MNAITFKRLFRRSDVLLSNCARPICKKTQILRRLCATGAGVLALVGVLGFTTATQPAIPYASSSFIEAQEAHQGKPAPIHTQLFTDEVKNSDAEPIDANEIAWIEVDEYTAEALLSAGVMEFIEIDEQGQAIYAMSSAPSVVIVVIQGTDGGPVVAPKPPPITLDPGQTWPPNWNYRGCTGPSSIGLFTCHYEQIWTASQAIRCPNGSIRRINYRYRRTCIMLVDNCDDCPSAPDCGNLPPNGWQNCPAGITKEVLLDTGCL